MGVAVASVLRVQDDISAEDERGHGVLKEHDNETEDSNQEGPLRLWVEIRAGVFLVPLLLDQDQNERGKRGLVGRNLFIPIVIGEMETARLSSAKSVAVFQEASLIYEAQLDVLILTSITDYV